VLYRLQGISPPPDPDGRRLFGATVRWFTDDPELDWLNDRLSFEEGVLEASNLHSTVYLLHPETPQAR
jgi:hypothetical protein